MSAIGISGHKIMSELCGMGQNERPTLSI